MDYGLWAVNYGLCTAACALWTMDYLKRNEAWDVYLESVQYGLDYILGVCKCL